MRSILRSINVISRCTNLYRADRLKGSDLGPNHHSYIFSICRHPGISQEELAHRVYINKSNVTRHLTRLEKAGYVKRVQSEEDKRVLLVYPTEKATETLPMLRGIVREWTDAVTEDFTDAEKEQLAEMLGRIAKKAAEICDKGHLGDE